MGSDLEPTFVLNDIQIFGLDFGGLLIYCLRMVCVYLSQHNKPTQPTLLAKPAGSQILAGLGITRTPGDRGRSPLQLKQSLR